PELGGGEAAGQLWESLQSCLLRLDDTVEIYPAHGAGSLCGRAMSSKTASTIGFERRFNGALRARSKAEFVEHLMAGLPPKPPSFPTTVGRNLPPPPPRPPHPPPSPPPPPGGPGVPSARRACPPCPPAPPTDRRP